MSAKSQTQLGTGYQDNTYETCPEGESGPLQVTLVTYAKAKKQNREGVFWQQYIARPTGCRWTTMTLKFKVPTTEI